MLQKHRQRICAVIISLVGAMLCLLPVLTQKGWPVNGEGLSFMTRTEMYAQHFRHGDLFPIWSADTYGIGAPLPLYYQKSFYYVAAWLLMIFGSIKIALILTLLGFMLAGMYGLRRCLQLLTKNPYLIALGPLLLVTNNYISQLWYLKGAMAEFSAAMIVPWLVWWCLSLLKNRTFSWWIVPILFVLFNAHNAVFLFAPIPLIAAYGIYLYKEGHDAWLGSRIHLAISVIALGVLLAPELLLQRYFLKYYNPARISEHGYRTSENFPNARHYLFSQGYGAWLLLSVLVLVAIILVVTRRKSLSGHWYRDSVPQFLAATLVGFVFLYLPLSRPLYTHVKLLEVIQFPTRLLAYILPLTLLVIIFLGEKIPNKRLAASAGALWLGVSLLFSPVFFTSRGSIPTKLFYYYQLDGFRSGHVWPKPALAEYLPRVYDNGRELDSQQLLSLYDALQRSDGSQPKLLTGGPCQTSWQRSTTYEPQKMVFSITCSSSASIALPISYNDFTDIRRSDGSELVYTRTWPNDPRIVIALPPGSERLKVTLPQIFR